MEYSKKLRKNVNVIETVKIAGTYQAADSEDTHSQDRRSYPAKKVRYERRNRVDPNSPYDNSINIKT